MTQPTQIITTDGTPIWATHFAPNTPTRGQIMVAGATAVPQYFYRRFAAHANAQGFAVTTFDYRGIGLSAPKTLRGYRMNWLDWGRKDMPAVLAAMQAQSNAPVFVVGHSYGGHGFGLMPTHAQVRRFYGFGVGAGWSGYMPKWERLRVEFLWHVLSPALNAAFGFSPWKLLRMGENLPLDLFYQWRRWCGFPHYYFDDPTMQSELGTYAQVKTPLAFVNALDDTWASPRSRDAFVAGYLNAPIERIAIAPQALGLTQIGHMGYFRPGAEALWDAALQVFDQDLRKCA
jgi:predicted alpha/beta hydrolase